MSNVIEDFCQKHGIGAQTLIDVYTDNLDRIVDSVQFPNHGVELIAEERKRQVEVEKWDYKHDADYKHGELIGAATCYAMSALNKLVGEEIGRAQIHVEAEKDWQINSGDRGDRRLQPARWVDAWPWDKQWDKRKKHDALRSLVIAGALIAAQIDLQLESATNE